MPQSSKSASGVNGNEVSQTKSAVKIRPDLTPPEDDIPLIGDLEKPKKKKKPKVTDWAIEDGLIKFMTADPKMPKALSKCSFPYEFRSWARNWEYGAFDLIEVKENGLVSSIDKRILARALSESMKSFLGRGQGFYQLPSAKVLKLADAYLLTEHRHFLKGDNAPKPFKFAHEKDKLAFNIIPTPAILEHFYPHPEFVRLAPFYSEMISRNAYPDVKRQFYGSLLNIGGPRKKMPWDWGLANAGKTTTNIALSQSIFGNNAVAVLSIEDIIGNKNLMYDLRDKMMVIIDDVPADFFTQNVAKTITGASKKQINGKFLHAYSDALHFRVLITSQFMSKWTGDSGHEARVIVNEVSPIKGEVLSVTELEERLKPELPYIIADIIHAYAPIYGKDIETPPKNLDPAKEAADEGRQFAFDAHFEAPDEVETSDPMFEIFEVTSGQFEAAFKFNRGDISIEAMRDFVKRKYNSTIGKRYRCKRWVTNIRPIISL